MQKVLVPLAITREKPNSIVPIHFVRETYVNLLAKHNLVPLFVSSISPHDVVDELYALTSGLFLMGGSDFDPKYYGEPPHEKTSVREPVRDKLEIYLIKKAITDKKPILGICRGCQALAIATGGSLVQHVPDIAQGEIHDACTSYDDLLTAHKHIIKIADGTKLRAIVGLSEINTNSAHHQSVRNPGINMVVSAVTPKGIVEAIENNDANYFCMGVQCHPEADTTGIFDNVLRAFREAVEGYSK